jgi:hypothetical protein
MYGQEALTSVARLSTKTLGRIERDVAEDSSGLSRKATISPRSRVN